MIEVNGVIYRNLEEQVQKNKDDIENLKNQQSGDDSDIEQIDNRLTEVETTLTEITPDVMRALKTPISAPNETKIVAVDNTNSQEMIGIGTGLVIENNTLKSTGGTEIVDNLTSSSISAGLSANQGRILDNKITNLSQTVNSKANQSALDITNQTVSQNSNEISSNTEKIEMLETDINSKTNVTINNVHQDYINFSSDPQTQINSKINTNLSNANFPIGFVYLSVNSTSPASLFGGTWEQITNNAKLLLGGTAIVKTTTEEINVTGYEGLKLKNTEDNSTPSGAEGVAVGSSGYLTHRNQSNVGSFVNYLAPSNLIADLSTTTNAVDVYIWKKIA